MTFSKHLPFLCAIAAGAICLTVRADDTDNAAQAAARIALAKALFEKGSSNAPATWSTPADTNVVMQPVDSKEAEKEAKAKAKADKAAAKAKAKADKEAADAQAEADKEAKEQADKKAAADAQTAAVQQAAQANADKAAADAAAAKAADDQKVNAEKAAIAAATMPSTNAEAQVQTTTATATNSTVLNYQWTPNGTNVSGATNSWASTPAAENQSATETKKEKKKKKEKEKEENDQAQAAAAANTAVQQPGTEIGMKPVAAPPLPISASKQDRLAALLQKYQADQITPDEYHSQRAAILAEP